MANPITPHHSFGSYFNPRSPEHHALDKFKQLDGYKQWAIGIVTAIVSVITLGTCMAPTFRLLTEQCKVSVIKLDRTSRDQEPFSRRGSVVSRSELTEKSAAESGSPPPTQIDSPSRRRSSLSEQLINKDEDIRKAESELFDTPVGTHKFKAPVITAAEKTTELREESAAESASISPRRSVPGNEPSPRSENAQQAPVSPKEFVAPKLFVDIPADKETEMIKDVTESPQKTEFSPTETSDDVITQETKPIAPQFPQTPTILTAEKADILYIEKIYNHFENKYAHAVEEKNQGPLKSQKDTFFNVLSRGLESVKDEDTILSDLKIYIEENPETLVLVYRDNVDEHNLDDKIIDLKYFKELLTCENIPQKLLADLETGDDFKGDIQMTSEYADIQKAVNRARCQLMSDVEGVNINLHDVIGVHDESVELDADTNELKPHHGANSEFSISEKAETFGHAKKTIDIISGNVTHIKGEVTSPKTEETYIQPRLLFKKSLQI